MLAVNLFIHLVNEAQNFEAGLYKAQLNSAFMVLQRCA